jgi:hypothetical protein
VGLDVDGFGAEPGEQQFVYLFPVLGNKIIHQGDQRTANDDLANEV